MSVRQSDNAVLRFGVIVMKDFFVPGTYIWGWYAFYTRYTKEGVLELSRELLEVLYQALPNFCYIFE